MPTRRTVLSGRSPRTGSTERKWSRGPSVISVCSVRLVDLGLRLEPELFVAARCRRTVSAIPMLPLSMQEESAVFCVASIWPDADVADVWFVRDRGLRFVQVSVVVVARRCFTDLPVRISTSPRTAHLVKVGEKPVSRS